MIRCIGWQTWIVLLASISFSSAGAYESLDGAPPASQPTGSEPSVPRDRAAEQPLPPPFQLAPDEQQDIDRLLDRWEQWNAQVKTFDCTFKRWIYDYVFNPPKPNQPIQPALIEIGVIKYAAPDRALFRVEKTEKEGVEVPIEDSRPEHWVFDGKSIFELNWARRQLIEYKLPLEFQGNQLVDGPLAFGFPTPMFWRVAWLFGGSPPTPRPIPFGAKAEQLRQPYYFRTITPPNRQDEIWLEAFPRYRREANWFLKMQLIFAAKDMSPFAVKIIQPNGKDYTTYQFFDVVVNGPPSAANGDPFRPIAPPGWKTIIHEVPRAAQARPLDSR